MAKGSRLAEITLKPIIFIVLLTFQVACRQPEKGMAPSEADFGKIIYDTYIVNRDTTDSWGEESLSGFNRKAFIDKIFDDVFDGRSTPFDYFSGEKISLSRLRELESNGTFSRKNISKIQFEERWEWDSQKAEIRKQVLSMTIAYDVYDNAGRLRGQKPIFRLTFKN